MICQCVIKSINKVIFVYVLLLEDGFCNINVLIPALELYSLDVCQQA